jgi:hypothetical protein
MILLAVVALILSLTPPASPAPPQDEQTQGRLIWPIVAEGRVKCGIEGRTFP